MAPDPVQRLAALGVAPGDVVERFARSPGPGGQHVNKTSTAVTLVCPKLKLSVTCHDTRSQARNRDLAWQRLAEAAESQAFHRLAERRARREKARRRNRPRPKGLRERILESKRHRGAVKRNRRSTQEE